MNHETKLDITIKFAFRFRIREECFTCVRLKPVSQTTNSYLKDIKNQIVEYILPVIFFILEQKVTEVIQQEI